MQTTTRVLLVSAVLLALVLAGSSAHSAIMKSSTPGGASFTDLRQSGQPPTVLYVLSIDSQYVQGCFPAPPFPCAGPLVLYPDFGGSFGLTATGVDGEGFSTFAMSELTLLAGGDGNVIVVEGAGSYRVNEETGQQQMTLEVLVNGQPTLFDSGLVDVGDGDDVIDIAVDVNDLVNYDILMTIVANPGVSGASMGG